jgi:hypothetical protein
MTPDKKLSPLEELGRVINKAVEENGKVRGEVSFVEGRGNVGNYPVTRIYSFSFLNRVVQEQHTYRSPSEVKEKAINDCIDSLGKVIKPEYEIDYENSFEQRKKHIIIKKPRKKSSCLLPYMHPSWLS